MGFFILGSSHFRNCYRLNLTFLYRQYPFPFSLLPISHFSPQAVPFFHFSTVYFPFFPTGSTFSNFPYCLFPIFPNRQYLFQFSLLLISQFPQQAVPSPKSATTYFPFFPTGSTFSNFHYCLFPIFLYRRYTFPISLLLICHLSI